MPRDFCALERAPRLPLQLVWLIGEPAALRTGGSHFGAVYTPRHQIWPVIDLLRRRARPHAGFRAALTAWYSSHGRRLLS